MAEEQKDKKINLSKVIGGEVWGQLLDTPQKREKALLDLSIMQTQGGWIFLEKAFQINLTIIEKAILDDVLTTEDEKEKKRDRMYLKLFKDFPRFVIELIQSRELSPHNENDDPYAS